MALVIRKTYGVDRPDVAYAVLARDRLSAMPPPADPDAFTLAYHVLHLSSLFVTDLESRIHRPRGWTLPGFRLMFKLWILGPTQPGRLAAISVMSRSAVTNALHTLERAGLVERRPNEVDRRTVEVALTDKGRQAVAAAYAEQAAREAEWFGTLDTPERETLAELLRRLVAARPPELPEPDA
jgi:DNA-binding MarR family transcriptional regulator